MPAWGWPLAASALMAVSAYPARWGIASSRVRLAFAWTLHGIHLAALAAALPRLEPWPAVGIFMGSFFPIMKAMTYLTEEPVRPGIRHYLAFWLVPYAATYGDFRLWTWNWRTTGRIVRGAVVELAFAALLAAAALGATTGSLQYGMLSFALMFVFMGSTGLVTSAHHVFGVHLEPPQKAPYLSRTLGEFWGRRWNLQFHFLIQPALYRPAAKAFGATTASWLAFFYSGIIHEALINGTVGTAWGTQLAFFLVQGAGLAIERRWRLRGRVWTIGFLLATCPLFAWALWDRRAEVYASLLGGAAP